MTTSMSTARSEAGGTDEAPVALTVGAVVEVRSRFDRRWSRGFSVHAVEHDCYRLRRTSDGAVLPVRFARDDIRASTTSRR